MNPIRRILAPTDLSEFSSAGVEHAFDMARRLGAELIIQHVVAVGAEWLSPPEELRRPRELLGDSERALDRFLREKFPGLMNLVEVRQKIEIGVPHKNIVQLAAREGVDIIVMSTHGRTGLDHIVMGSVTEKVVARAPCPVLAIPPRGRRAPVAKAA